MINDQAVRNWDFGEIVQAYSQRDTILYALGVGFGADPLDAGQLRYVYEQNLQSVPSMVSTLGWPGFWWQDPRTGVNCEHLVQGEQHVRLFRPLPVEGTLRAHHRVASLTDKGTGKGAIASVIRDIYDDATGELIAQSTNITFLRADGGFSEFSGVNDPPPPSLPKVPERKADHEVILTSLPQAALIYRLSGDYNPLHAEPGRAETAGFSRPILHGLCSFGMATHAILKACCEYDASRIKAIAMRFSAPVYPGETLRFEIWRENAFYLHMRAHVDSRQSLVLNNGVIELIN